MADTHLGLSVSEFSIRLGRVWALIGCLLGRHKWAKQGGTFGDEKVGPDGRFYEAYYCWYCGRGYPSVSILKAIWLTVVDR
jgi:hypothetical protein